MIDLMHELLCSWMTTKARYSNDKPSLYLMHPADFRKLLVETNGSLYHTDFSFGMINEFRGIRIVKSFDAIENRVELI